MHRLRLFFVFLFYIVGLLGYLISTYLLLISLVPFAFLFFYKKEKRSPFYFLFLAMGYLLPLIIPKGNLDITSLDGIVIQQKENYYILLTLSGKYYISSKGNVPSLFSLLHLDGTAKAISETHYESVFSFKNYLKTQGVFYQFNPANRTDIFLNPISNVPLRNYIFQFLEDKPRLFVTAILCGDSMYSIEENEALSQLGILNALSLSGFHLSFLFHIMDLFLPKKRERLLPIIKIGLLFFFLFLSGFRYSIRRILFFGNPVADFRKDQIQPYLFGKIIHHCTNLFYDGTLFHTQWIILLSFLSSISTGIVSDKEKKKDGIHTFHLSLLSAIQNVTIPTILPTFSIIEFDFHPFKPRSLPSITFSRIHSPDWTPTQSDYKFDSSSIFFHAKHTFLSGNGFAWDFIPDFLLWAYLDHISRKGLPFQKTNKDVLHCHLFDIFYNFYS